MFSQFLVNTIEHRNSELCSVMLAPGWSSTLSVQTLVIVSSFEIYFYNSSVVTKNVKNTLYCTSDLIKI